MHIIREQSFKLSEYIESYWLMEADQTDFKSDNFSNMIPEGIFELIFELDNPVRIAHKSNQWESRPKSFIGGLFDQVYELKSSGKIRLFGARFKSGKMSNFTSIPLIEFKNQLIDIRNVFHGASQLEDEINNADSFYEMIQLCEDFLIKQINSTIRNQKVLNTILSTITEANGNIYIHDLCEEFKMNELKLRRLFYNQIGINPKTFCKINRLNYFLGRLNRTDRRLTETTFDMGYFDQSHFIRDVKSVMGKSPKNCHLNKFQLQFIENPQQIAEDLSFSL